MEKVYESLSRIRYCSHFSSFFINLSRRFSSHVSFCSQVSAASEPLHCGSGSSDCSRVLWRFSRGSCWLAGEVFQHMFQTPCGNWCFKMVQTCSNTFCGTCFSVTFSHLSWKKLEARDATDAIRWIQRGTYQGSGLCTPAPSVDFKIT